MTSRKGKEVNSGDIGENDHSSDTLDSEKSSPKEKKESSPWEYVSKVPFPQRLVKVKKENSTGEIIEIFNQVRINIPFLDAVKQVPSYAKFL